MIPDPKDLIDVGQAGQLVGESKRSITYWIKNGTRLKDGRVLQLKALALPNGLRTTEQWVTEFVTELTRDRTRQAVPVDDNRARRANAVAAASGW
jgi:hypothetical protein